MAKLPKYYMLSFLHDNDYGCALTVLVDGAWYHIIADPARFNDRSKRGKRISNEYRCLLNEVKAAEGTEEGEGTAPLFVHENEVDSSPEGERDSAVDMSTPTDEQDTEDEHAGEPTKKLERWMLRPLREVFADRKFQSQDANRTVQDWYHCPKYFFDLFAKDGKLLADEDEAPSKKLQNRLEYLVPSMPLPKYIRNLKISPINANDLIVLQESPDPAPIHPTKVRHNNGTEYFLKLVDPNQYQPTKREIQVMKRIESKGLQDQLRVPLLRGLVHFSDTSQNTVMGFVMDAIDNPTPLTLLIDADVDETKRLAWAEESARMVDVLHQNGIIWGDAKGDNFMVDKHGDLWIIDFGGSYTEGWVDPELKETEEGDMMGVRKICNGLEDPEKNTIGDEEEEEEEEQHNAQKLDCDSNEEEKGGKEDIAYDMGNTARIEGKSEGEAKTSHRGRKRKSLDAAEIEEDKRANRKQTKRASDSVERARGGADADEPLYCHCKQLSSGDMIACDGEDCAKQWFHFACVGLQEAPAGTEKWYCEDCQNK